MFKSRFFWIAITLLLIVAGVWFLIEVDRTPPSITLSDEVKFINRKRNLEFSVEDIKSGLLFIQVSIKQGTDEKNIARFDFPEKGIYRKNLQLDIKPKATGLKDGKALLIISAGDHSTFFDNETIIKKETIIDTHPPQLEVESLSHYINMGGSCLVTYNVSKDASKSGIQVDDLFFRGFSDSPSGAHVAYFTLPWNTPASPSIVLMAIDDAGNMTKVSFPYSIRKKKFKKERINISDRFLDRKIPEFTNRYDNLEGSNLDIYLKINREMRAENNLKIKAICSRPHPNRLWKGTFLRMRGSQKAEFAAKRTYYYKGKEIDKQEHLGVDLAAVKRFPVKSANNGIVVFTDYLGIYGNTVIIDHGQGIFSMYSHLSGFKVKPDMKVKKGAIVGNTGTTGMAGGDHLHFSILVQGIFVNPKEWWDPHWIKDNIIAKLRPDKSK